MSINKKQTYRKLFICAGIALVLMVNSVRICRAQLNNTVFEDFNQTMVNPYLVNPAAGDTSYRFNLRFNNINEIGFARNVSRFYVDGDKRYASKERDEFHFLGLQMTNSKIGDYISRSRFQARYSWFSAVSKKAAISSGVSLGFVNYALLTTQGGGGGSDLAQDGAIGIHYLREYFTLGLAVQQIFSPVLLPVNQSFQLNRVYNVNMERRFRLGPKTQLTAHSVLQLSGKGIMSFNTGLFSEISDVALAGINHFSFRKTSFQLGLQQIQMLDIDIMIMGVYSLYHSQVSLPDNALEIFIAFQK